MSIVRRIFALHSKASEVGVNADQRVHVTDQLPANPVIAQSRALDDIGQFGEALSLLDAALQSRPMDGELHFARASSLFVAGRCIESIVAALRAQALGTTRFQLSVLLGLANYRVGRLHESEKYMRDALRKDDNATAHMNLAVVLQALGKFDEASREYGTANALSPGNFDALMGLGGCYLSQQNFVGAEVCYHQALEVQPSSASAWNHLGVVLGKLMYLERAEAAFRQSVALEPDPQDQPELLTNLAILLRDSGAVGEAIELFERVLQRTPAVHAQCSYAHALLRAGRWDDGWAMYESRWLQEPLVSLRSTFPRPTWSGQSLDGKTIFLRAEQGAGDIIQFIRYAPMLKSMGARTVFRPLLGLNELAKGFAGIDQLLGPDEPVPNFDYYVHLMSLPRWLQWRPTELSPANCYLDQSQAHVEKWSNRIRDHGQLKVGLAWAGSNSHANDRNRSMTFNQIFPLLQISGARFYALQKRPSNASVPQHPDLNSVQFIDLGSDLEDYCDTAAVMGRMDLVITVDTSVAHLAGALGRPTWVMLAEPSDFRWQYDRSDTHWYPSMRLFRQRASGDWLTVIRSVASALAELVADHRQGISDRNRDVAKDSEIHLASARDDSEPAEASCRLEVVETQVGILQIRHSATRAERALQFYGGYLQEQMSLLTRCCESGATVLQMGAGVGAETILLARAVGESGHVLAFEADVYVRRLLQNNLSANKARNVTVLEHLGAKARIRAVDKIEGESSPLVEINCESPTGIDMLYLDHLDFLVLSDEDSDSEQAIDGATRTIWRDRPRIFVKNIKRDEIAKMIAKLRDLAYRCWKIESSWFDSPNFYNRDEDIFDGAVSIAVLALPEEMPVNSVAGAIEVT